MSSHTPPRPGQPIGDAPPRPRVSVHGLGPRGAAHAADLAEFGFQVTGHDPDSLLRRQFELDGPDGTPLGRRLHAGRHSGLLSSAGSAAEATSGADIHVISIENDTPDAATRLRDAVSAVGPHLRPGALVVGIGEVPPGAAAAARDQLLEVSPTLRFDLAWVCEPPAADATPDHIVVQAESRRAESLLRGMYHPVIARGTRLQVHPLTCAGGPAARPAPPLPRPAPRSAPIPVADTAVPKTAAVPRSERGFRPDIEGLRAVAVLLVVLYHAELLGVRGGFVGVDVFFVISGYLITRQLFQVQCSRGRVQLIEFYVRRMKRLLPAAAIVTLAVLAAARFWSGPMAARDVARDAFFSAVYGMNFHLAAQGTDYLNADEPPSPLQHYWSLSVEEQFYIAFPFLVLAVAVVALRFQRAALTGVLAVIVGGSLYLSVTTTPENGVTAYFSTGTRAWEFALGGLVAMLGPVLIRLPRAVAVPASWAGLGLIIFAGLTFDGRTEFPGSAALLPVGGAALLIAAGARLVPGGAETLLGRRPAQALGRLSYSLYLWHWPALFFLPLALDRALTPQLRLAAIAIAVALSTVTFAAVEAPLRRVTLRRPVWMIPGIGVSAATAATAVVFAATLPSLAGAGAPAQAVTLTPASTGDSTVAAALQAGLATKTVPRNLRPALNDAENDHDYGTGCHLNFERVAAPPCIFGATGDPAARTMVLFGDSHAAHWFAPLQALAEARGWKLVWRTKSACAPADVPAYSEQLKRDYRECAQWRNDTVAEIATLKPDLVIVGQADIVPGVTATDAEFATGTVKTLTELRRSGAWVVLLGDVPQAPQDPVECLAENLTDAQACSYSRTQGYRSFPDRQATLATALQQQGLEMVPTTNWICGPQRCPPLVADMLVYRDADHLTKVFASWLAPMLEPVLLFAEARTPVTPAATTAPTSPPRAAPDTAGPPPPSAPPAPSPPPTPAPPAAAPAPPPPPAAAPAPPPSAGAVSAPGWGRPERTPVPGG